MGWASLIGPLMESPILNNIIFKNVEKEKTFNFELVDPTIHLFIVGRL